MRFLLIFIKENVKYRTYDTYYEKKLEIVITAPRFMT